MTEPRPNAGLRLLLNRAWGQEVVHQLVLRELLAHTALARELGLWQQEVAPSVLYEPFNGLFDLALADAEPRVLIELKVGAELSDNQRGRQRARAAELAAQRVYVLMGPSFFMAQNEPEARNIGSPELAAAVRKAVGQLGGTLGQPGPLGELSALGDLGRTYADRLEMDAAAWAGEHDPRAQSGIDLFRLYSEMAACWPITTRPSKVTNRGGPDWILNAQAWTRIGTPGWEPAQFYWEIVNGRTRFKVNWAGDEALRLVVREHFREALETAAREIGEGVSRTHRRLGSAMSALQLSGDVRDEVLVEGRVSAEKSRQLYDRATALFLRSIELLPSLTEPRG